MSQSGRNNKDLSTQQAPLSLWKFIVLIILFTFAVVALFGVIIYLLVNGAQQMGLSATSYVVILVVISGVFAWLVKRVSDTISGMSHHWFSEESEDQD